MTFAVFLDFPGLENGPPKFHDFPGPVGTLEARVNNLPKTYATLNGCKSIRVNRRFIP